jgi:hypothetical protein
VALGDASCYAAPVDHHSGSTGGEYPASSWPQPMVDNSCVCATGKSDRVMGVRVHPMAQPRLGRWPAGVSSAVRDRNAIFGYLSAVFDLVMWWAAENRAVSRARWALKLQGVDATNADEPFAASFSPPLMVRKSTSEPEVNGRACCGTRWSTNRLPSRSTKFVKRKGGGSTSVRSDSAVASVEGVVVEARNRSWHQRDFTKSLGHDSFGA